MTLKQALRPLAPSGRLGLRMSLAAAAIVALSTVGAYAQAGDPVVAKVNGVDIKQSDLALAEEDLGQNLPPMPEDGKRDYLIKYLTDIMTVAKAAEDRKIADTADFKQRLAFARNKLLMETLLQNEGKAAVTDAEVRKVYEEAAKQMGQEQEVRARHILVETEDEAKKIRAELQKGTDFAELAKQKSKDPGASEGGDLGFFTKEQMVPEFADVAFKLEKGQLSEPVKTQFGWHIIRVEDKRTRQAPTLDQVKGQIETYVARKAQAELVAKLRDGAKVERLDAKPADASKPVDAKPAEAKPAEPKKN